MEPKHTFSFVICVAIGIYLIVNPDTVGQMTGYVRGHYIDAPTPGCLIRFFGCMMVAVLPGAAVAFALVWWAGVLAGLAVAIGLYVLANRLLPR